jgi:primosomal protein N' (replication factor Y)
LVKTFSREAVKFFISEGVLCLSEVEVRAQAYFDAIVSDEHKLLNAEQAAAYETIIDDRQDKPFL